MSRKSPTWWPFLYSPRLESVMKPCASPRFCCSPFAGLARPGVDPDTLRSSTGNCRTPVLEAVSAGYRRVGRDRFRACFTVPFISPGSAGRRPAVDDSGRRGWRAPGPSRRLGRSLRGGAIDLMLPAWLFLLIIVRTAAPERRAAGHRDRDLQAHRPGLAAGRRLVRAAAATSLLDLVIQARATALGNGRVLFSTCCPMCSRFCSLSFAPRFPSTFLPSQSGAARPGVAIHFPRGNLLRPLEAAWRRLASGRRCPEHVVVSCLYLTQSSG